MRTIESTLYWAFSGASMGFGIAAVWSIGIPILLIGIFFMSYGLTRLNRQGLWAALVAFGAVPDAIFLYNYSRSDGYTQFVGGNIALTLLVPFGLVAFGGMVWGLGQAFTKSRRRANEAGSSQAGAHVEEKENSL
ncbi:MAG: hypothetical protein ABIO92_06460 [Chloroflexia bacterium]